jgi:hypothetical protein
VLNRNVEINGLGIMTDVNAYVIMFKNVLQINNGISILVNVKIFVLKKIV